MPSHLASAVSSSNVSRRSFLQISTAASVAAVFGIPTEATLAYAQMEQQPPRDAVVIDANENPLGPSAKARQAAIDRVPHGGRYALWEATEVEQIFATQQGLSPEYVKVFPGSSMPLHYAVLAYTSPTRSYVTADPGYEAGMYASKSSGARIVKVPLTRNHAHDVKAMLAAAPDAGLFYVCTPNNPTGTMTSHADIEYLVANKPKGSIVMVDEAYIHFSGGASTLDLVKANQDIIVLRTFSKAYGMAGLRCGFIIARPDVMARVVAFSGWDAMPVTACAAAKASLLEPSLAPERKRINTQTRTSVFAWLDQNGYSYIPSESNCFLLDTKRPGQEVRTAMAAQNVYIGRIWPIMPTYVRITVGTPEEMGRFQSAFHHVMKNAVAVAVPAMPGRPQRYVSIDGLRIPGDFLLNS